MTELPMTASKDSSGENESKPRDAGSGECFERFTEDVVPETEQGTVLAIVTG